MTPKANRHSDEEWLSRKAEIRALFIEKGQKLPEVLQHMESQGFSVSKSQLEYKLKTWGFKKKLPKNRSQKAWQYIRHNVEKRKKQGKESEVILSGRRLDQRTIERESSRHHSNAWSASFQNVTSPRTPEGIPISICTPAALTMDFRWHKSLPWVQFQKKVSLAATAPVHLLGNCNATASPLAPLRLEDSGYLHLSTDVSALSYRIGSIMPESYEGENFDRAEKLARGPSNEATQEQVNIAIFKLSNKLDTGMSWQQKLGILETSGIMSSRIQLNQNTGNLSTVSALAEDFYQDAFAFIYDSRSHETLGNLATRSFKLITWLLSLGYNSDTSVYLPTPDVMATGLQIALFCENYELACVLLDSRANPNPLDRYMTSSGVDQVVASSPPLFIAISRANSTVRNTIIRRLLAAGADLKAEQGSDGFLTTVSTLSMLSGAAEDEAEMQEVMDILHIDLLKSVTADVLIAAAWNGKIRNLEFLLRINPDVNMTNRFGLTALHAAARQGHAEVCEMLLQKGSFVDYPEQGAPSPLHFAALENHIDIVRMLHQHGASLLRGIELSPDNGEAGYSRYFRHYNRADFPNYRYALSGSLLESPIGAALYASDSEGNTPVTYLVRNGVKLPAFAVYVAASRRLPHLLSIALEQGLDLNHVGSDGLTPLQKVLMNVQKNDKSTCMQIASNLLDAGAIIKGGEAILALSELGSWDIVMKILSSDHDGIAEHLDCITPYITARDGWIGKTLLETAILEGSGSLIEHVFALEPNEYSAGALCAACFQAARGGSSLNTLALLERLLQNRAKASTRHQEDSVCETTAVGIAAWSGSTAMLEFLHAYIPVSHLAYLPDDYTCNKLTSSCADLPKLQYTRRPLAFWHQPHFGGMVDYQLTGSPVTFALSKPKILDQLLNYGYKLDRICLMIMDNLGDPSSVRTLVQGREVLHDNLASENNSPLYRAFTKDNIGMSTLLLHPGQDINEEESELDGGRSPLARAVEMNNLSLIDILLEAGADVNEPPARVCGRTALQCAAAQGLLGIAKRLIEHGADINARRCEVDGRTALEAAAEYGRINMVQFLLSEGVETTGYNRYQYVRAIAWAKIKGHYATASMLEEQRKWTDEDQTFRESNHLWNHSEKWREDDMEVSSMASADASAEAPYGTAGYFVREDTESIKEDGEMDPSDSSFW